jgi:hypothetical protein
MRKLTYVSLSLAVCIGMAGCAPKDKHVPLTEEQNQVKTRLEAQVQATAATAQTYHAMDNSVLLDRLLAESKAQREPFNSLAYRELKTRSGVDSKALAALVKDNPNTSGLLPLLLLRKLDNELYLELPAELRAKVLTDALGSSKFFNTWGIPNHYLEDASNAMIEAGRSATPALKKMLSDTRPAPVFGSQEAMLSKQLQYRLCDYALFFLMRIDGKGDFRLPTAVADRDALIKTAAE